MFSTHFAILLINFLLPTLVHAGTSNRAAPRKSHQGISLPFLVIGQSWRISLSDLSLAQPSYRQEKSLAYPPAALPSCGMVKPVPSSSCNPILHQLHHSPGNIQDLNPMSKANTEDGLRWIWASVHAHLLLYLPRVCYFGEG